MGLFGTGWDDVEHAVGDLVNDGSRAVGDGLNALGQHGAAQAVETAGDKLGYDLGGNVGELQLGETDDPRELVHGDAAAIRSAATSLMKFAVAFGETSDGLGRIETGHWTGAAADAFRARFSPEPGRWQTAAEAMGRVCGALEPYAEAVEAAQEQARQAAELWRQGQEQKRRELQEEAQRMLAAARQARGEAASLTAATVREAAELAPAEPSFLDRLGDDVSDTVTAAGLAVDSVATGVVQGVAGIVRFAQTINPLDPWNLAHPGEYLAGLSGTVAGLAEGVLNPTKLIQGMLGSGWSTDPFQSFGKLVPNLALAALTDGGGTAADAAEDATEDAAENTAANTAENAASRPEDARPSVSDPVDIATGEVTLAQTDAGLPGALPLVLRRMHRSAQRGGRWFGESWISTLDQRVAVRGGLVAAVFSDGQVLLYPRQNTQTPNPRNGDNPNAGGGDSRAATALPKAGPAWPLRQEADGSCEVTDPQRGLTWRYEPRPGYWRDPGGQGEMPLVSVTDRVGHVLGFEYDGQGQPTAVTHSGGYRIAVTVTDGRITGLSLGDVSLTGYAYDESGQLTEVTDSSGQPQRFSYDPDGRLAGWTDRNGHSYTYAYDESGRCVRGESPSGALSAGYEYGDGVTRWTNATGAVTEYTIDKAARVTAITDPLGNVTRFEHDPRNRVTARTDPLGRVTRYAYNDAGNMTGVTRPDGAVSRAVYDGRGQAVELSEPDGSVLRQEFDDRGNQTAHTWPDGTVTRYEYDEARHLAAVTAPDGTVTRTGCDAAGLPVLATGPDGKTVRYERDRFGRTISITDPSGAVTSMSWTPEGRPASRTLPDGSAESWEWDGEGNLARHVSPAGTVTAYEYGPFDKTTVVKRPDGTRTVSAYDPELRLESVTHGGLTWRYAYDAAGRLESGTDYNGAVTRYSYDAAGQLVKRVNATGQETAYAYDPAGNPTEQRSVDAVTTFGYDPAGRLAYARNADAEVSFTRDALGRVTTETCNGATVATSYDTAGRVTGRTTPSGTVTAWDYDDTGLPAAIRSGRHELRFAYGPGGRETRRELPGGLTLSQDWDQMGRLSGQALTGPGLPGPLQQRSYAYSADGFVTGISDLVTGDRSFGLDATGRVTTVTGTGWSEQYAYDPAGNITSATLPAPPTGSPAPWGESDPGGGREITGTLIRRAGTLRYHYDAAGRVTARIRTRVSRKPDTWHYQWDADSRLTSVTMPDKTTWRYRYDPLGRRIAKQHLGTDGTLTAETRFTWDGTVLAEQAETAGDDRQQVTTWDYQPGTFIPLAQASRTSLRTAPLEDMPQDVIDERFRAIITDLAGTPAELVAPDGTLAGHQQRTLWGNTAWHSSGEATPLRFPGQFADPETGLHYNSQRYYDPVSGAYLSPDPLGLAPSPNPHSYVSNPCVLADPLGLAACQPGDPAGYGAGSGPWADGVNATPGGAVPQITNGSCVSACGEMLSGGAATQADLLTKLGDWSNPQALAQALGKGWTGGYFGSGEDALAAASSGPMGAALRVGTNAGHMVVTSPLGGGRFLVMDPWGGGSTYEVGSQWIEQYVEGGTFR